MTAIVVIEAVVLFLLLVLVAGLLKSHAEILRQLHRLGGSVEGDVPRATPTLRAPGFEKTPVVEISGTEPSGSTRSISLEHGRGETLLAFLSTGCSSCSVFWDALGSDIEMPTPNTRPVIVTKGAAAESPGKVAELAPAGVTLIMSDDAWETFRVPLTPYFMLVDGEARVIGEGSASSWSHLMSLLRQSASDSDPTLLDTADRERFTDTRLHRSGVEPGDPTLYERPIYK